VGDATAKLINMENYRRRRLFFETGRVDYSWMSAWARRKAEYYSYSQAAKVPMRVKVLSFIPTASKVVAVNGKKSSNPAQRRGNRWRVR